MGRKRGFTLIELLIVVVVIVTLMAVTFRIGETGSNAKKRATTIARMQRLENCLSGYHAAYGSYPPVALHGSRDYRYEINEFGIQKLNSKWTGPLEGTDFSHSNEVKVACRSQPVAYECPYTQAFESLIDQWSQYQVQEGKRGFGGGDYGRLGFTHETWKNKNASWSNLQLFKFGLMSYLLPRVLLMSNGPTDDNKTSVRSDEKLNELLDAQRQWLDNNDMIVNLETGVPYSSWQDAMEDLSEGKKLWQLALQPSQAVCARWIANLSRCVAYTLNANPQRIYGVDVSADSDDAGGKQYFHLYETMYPYPTGTQGDIIGTVYVLRKFSMKDGYDHELYYYSPAPYQTYVLWSAGENGNTFPPWVDKETLDAADLKTAMKWASDDIVHMKN